MNFELFHRPQQEVEDLQKMLETERSQAESEKSRLRTDRENTESLSRMLQEQVGEVRFEPEVFSETLYKISTM